MSFQTKEFTGSDTVAPCTLKDDLTTDEIISQAQQTQSHAKELSILMLGVCHSLQSPRTTETVFKTKTFENDHFTDVDKEYILARRSKSFFKKTNEKNKPRHRAEKTQHNE